MFFAPSVAFVKKKMPILPVPLKKESVLTVTNFAV